MAADRADATAVVFRPDGLGRVFHQGDALRPGDLGQGHRIDRLAEKVHGNDRLGSRRDQRCHVFGIDIEGGGVDVGEYRLGAEPRHGAGRGEEREAGQDHLVAGRYIQGHQGQEQGVAARGAADGVLGLAIGGHELFELRDFRASTKPPLSQTRSSAARICGFNPECCRARSKSGTPWRVLV